MKYTIGDIHNSDSFVLISNDFLNIDTKLDKTYELFHDSNMSTFHFNELGKPVYHARGGWITDGIELFIDEESIIYHEIRKELQPDDSNTDDMVFHINQIDTVHHTDPKLYELTIRVDTNGKKLLANMEGKTRLMNDVRRLSDQRDLLDDEIEDIHRQIDQLF